MSRFENSRERREKQDKFQNFKRPKLHISRTSALGKIYIDYKDTESLKKLISPNGKILSRKRSGAHGDGTADDQSGSQARPPHGIAPVRYNGSLSDCRSGRGVYCHPVLHSLHSGLVHGSMLRRCIPFPKSFFNLHFDRTGDFVPAAMSSPAGRTR